MKQPDCVITIAGPGSVINNELAIVEKAFRDAGFDVEVENSHPDPELTAEQVINHLKLVHGSQPLGHIKIVMKHYPWGG